MSVRVRLIIFLMNNVMNEKIKVRDSNIELLRIVAMFLLLVDHAGYMSIQPPTQADIATNPLLSFNRFFCQSLSSICVDVFVLVSGWFGIKTRISRIVEFLFQCYFLSFVLYYGLLSLDLANPMSYREWLQFLLFDNLWFVKAFLLLYLFSPMINQFIEGISQQKFIYYLSAFFVLQVLHGFFIQSPWFDKGQSPLTLIFLYMLGRYLRCYPNRYTTLSKSIDIVLYLLLSVLTAFLSFISVTLGAEGYRLFSYNSPVLISASVFFFLFFTKLSFKSRLVNWVAASCFAVYVVNCETHFWKIYIRTIGKLWNSEQIIPFVLYTLLIIFLVYVSAIFLDRVRILIYRMIVFVSSIYIC